MSNSLMIQSADGSWFLLGPDNPLTVSIQSQSSDLQRTERERLEKANDIRIRVKSRTPEGKPAIYSYTSTSLNLTYYATTLYTADGDYDGESWDKV